MKDLRQECRDILRNAKVPSSKITQFLGSDKGGRVHPLTQTLSFKILMQVYNAEGDLKKIFKYAKQHLKES